MTLRSCVAIRQPTFGDGVEIYTFDSNSCNRKCDMFVLGFQGDVKISSNL